MNKISYVVLKGYFLYRHQIWVDPPLILKRVFGITCLIKSSPSVRTSWMPSSFSCCLKLLMLTLIAYMLYMWLPKKLQYTHTHIYIWWHQNWFIKHEKLYIFWMKNFIFLIISTCFIKFTTLDLKIRNLVILFLL